MWALISGYRIRAGTAGSLFQNKAEQSMLKAKLGALFDSGFENTLDMGVPIID